MSKDLSRRGLLGGLLASLAGLLHSPEQAPAQAPPAPATPPPAPLAQSSDGYDSGGLVSIDDGLTLRLTWTSADYLASTQPLNKPDEPLSAPVA